MSDWCRSMAFAALGIVLTIVAGCGGGSEARSSGISGTVTYQGSPVSIGSIQFRPTGATGGLAGYADIVDGKYNTAEKGKGVNGGSFTVLITGFDGNADPAAELPFGKPLFPEFKATIEVTAGEDVTQDFHVK